MIRALFTTVAEMFVGLIAVFAILLGVASVIARKSDDPQERRDATVTAFWSLVVFAICAGSILTLSGCSRNEIQYLGCLARDNTSHPCQ